jgi:hypothetical protein
VIDIINLFIEISIPMPGDVDPSTFGDFLLFSRVRQEDFRQLLATANHLGYINESAQTSTWHELKADLYRARLVGRERRGKSSLKTR